jgi:transcriptional regulator with XRE-family HTH domain
MLIIYLTIAISESYKEATMKYKNIQEYLDRTGKTEKQLADRIGVSQAFVSMLKRGEKRPSPKLAQRIESVTGIPFRALLLDSNA